MLLEPCLICSDRELKNIRTRKGVRVGSCIGCGVGRRISGNSPIEFGNENELENANRCASALRRYGLERGTVLIVQSDSAPFGTQINLREKLGSIGYSVFSADVNSIARSKQQFDAVCVLDGFDSTIAGQPALARYSQLLKPAGLLLAFVRNSGKEQQSVWSDSEQYFFQLPQLQLLLEKSGFRNIWVSPLQKGSFVSCLKSDGMSKGRLSIVMPVYNERSTFEETVEKVLNKRVSGVSEKELIIVESNSNDGTRELVRRYESHPNVKVIYEHQPRGKGHAVRTGLKHASGEIVMIQDADSEYDVDDYDELVKPLLDFKEPFVLGSRHKGDFKMRSFTNEPALALLFNFGQILFTTLMNVLYGQNMTDPFTMYKVFRRECLYGLHFECNRFDFDHELVIKLLLKGYTPHEIPVNYWSRSYSEGKKVTVILDPLLWIKANFKYRFGSPFKPAVQDLHRRVTTFKTIARRPQVQDQSGVPLPR